MPDIDKLHAHYSGEPWWFETGLDHGEDSEVIVYPHGVEARFKRYHLDRVFPMLTDLTRASQRMQLVALKYEIEQMRLRSSLQGNVITEFTDVHWEANGLLDILRNPKASFYALGHINSDDLVIPYTKRVALWSGEACVVRLSVSHYSQLDLVGSCVDGNWRVGLKCMVRRERSRRNMPT